MFHLEKAIVTWRHQFRYAPAISGSDLDEMERHLRDQVEELVQSGRDEETAFREAVREMGSVLDAEREFSSIRWKKARHEKRTFSELAVVFAMVVNYVKLAFRNLARNRTASLINIVGLTIALGTSIVVYIFLAAWNTMDDYHLDGERLFLVQHDVEREHQTETWGTVPAPLGEVLESDLPQVESALRINHGGASVRRDDQVFDEYVTFVDADFFDVLTFPLAAGTSRTLKMRDGVIVSAAMAEKYFGGGDPIGQSLEFTFDHQTTRTMIVGGVTAAPPSNTGFRFNFLIGFDTQRDLGLLDPDDWGSMTSGLVVKTRSASDAVTVAEAMNVYLTRQNAANPDWPIRQFALDSFTNPASDAYRVRGRIAEPAHPAVNAIFILIALFMLALSCFNYINISLGSSARRLKEIGMRKVAGGQRGQLVFQFLIENLLLCFIALSLGLILAKSALVPAMNSIFVMQIQLNFVGNLQLWGFLVVLLFLVAAISGAYPALYVSSFQPDTIFRGRALLSRNHWFTRGFMTFQFVLAFITVILGVVLTLNSRYLARQDWGYDPAKTLVVELEQADNYGALRDMVVQHASVVGVAGSAQHVGRTVDRLTFTSPDGGELNLLRYNVSPGYLESMGMRLERGRFFDQNHRLDTESAVVINESLARAEGWSDPLGRSMKIDGGEYEVIGVVDDFTFFFLARPQPTVFLARSATDFNYMTVRFNRGSDSDVRRFVESSWESMAPGTPLRMYFQRNVFDDQFDNYNRIVSVISTISALALLIACMGLFGLGSQNLTRRMKEMSIRKVVGASVARMAFLLNRGFIFQITIAGVAATILCFSGFTILLSIVSESVPINHMPFSPAPFLYAYLLVLATAFLSTASQIRALSRANPADVLRND